MHARRRRRMRQTTRRGIGRPEACRGPGTVHGSQRCRQRELAMITLLLKIFTVSHRRHVAVLLASAIGCVVAGAGLFALTQRIPFTTGLYWAITTATTVGYGDVTPHNPAGKVVAVAVMLTTIPLLASVFALLTGAAAASGVRRILAMRHRFPDGAYRIVIGMDSPVPAVLDELVQAGEQVVLVADVDPSSVRGEVHLIRGDPVQPAVIAAARPQGARQALITGATDGDVLVSAVLLRKQAPDLRAVALVRSPSVREALRDLGVWQVISPSEMIAHMLAQLVASNAHSLTEVQADAATIGRPLSAIRGERSGLVLGLVRDGRFSLALGDDPVVAPGDSLLLAVPARA